MAPRLALLCFFVTVPAYAQSTPTALVKEWLSAQNRGDFAGYQRLYAQQFTGIRRSGQKVVELDRAGWMKDRERMFKKPMIVSANQLTIDWDKVQFVQTWQSGDYIDTGRKQMVIVREGPEWKIAREELLESVSGEVLPKLDATGLAAFKLLYPKGAGNVLKAEIAARKDGSQVLFLVFGTSLGGDEEPEPEQFELALVKDGALLARGKWDFELPLSEGIEIAGGVTTFTPTWKVDPAWAELVEGEWAIGLWIGMVAHVNGPQDGGITKEHVMLFRNLDGKLRRVLSVQTSEDTGDAECSSGTQRKLSLLESETAGVTDILQTTTVTDSTFTGRDCKYKEKTTRKTWKWSGKAYR
jgi:hypothetical protein